MAGHRKSKKVTGQPVEGIGFAREWNPWIGSKCVRQKPRSETEQRALMVDRWVMEYIDGDIILLKANSGAGNYEFEWCNAQGELVLWLER